MKKGWKYYNHALIPTAAPHEKVEIPRLNHEFWKNGGGVFPCLPDGLQIMIVDMKHLGGM